ITMLKKVCGGLCFSIILTTSCSSKTLDLVNSDNSNRINHNGLSSDQKLYYLDLNKPSIVQPIDAQSEAAERYKFVQVEVVEVVNPKKHPVAFQVHYQTRTNEKIYLGSFGLYPSDNPGKFIVATQGKLKNEGAIVLTLVVQDKVDAADTVRVGIKKIKLVKE
ncbi:MAG: hypothetical protein M3R69_02535, partial [Acidobacteriota bacterium]|nr:hypothetical protein [Acidobacteriota bacterium]